MARHASTYRQARRKAWKELKPISPDTGEPMTWFEFNGKRGKFGEGSRYAPAKFLLPKPSKDYRGKLGANDQARKAKATSPVLSA